MADEDRRSTIEELIASGAIIAHKDGNYGSSYPRVEEFGAEGVPFLTAKSLRDGYVDITGAPRLENTRADQLTFGFVLADDVLLSHNATIGRVAVVPQHTGRLLVGTSLTYFRVDPEKLLPRYLAVYFAGKDFQNQLAAVMSHSTRNQVPVTAQRKLHVVVPPLPDQKAIAAVLGVLDDKIELNRRMNAKLEDVARALFQSWFVDFDPVRAKLDGREPVGLDSGTAALFPATFDETKTGHVPHGWRLGSIYEIANVIYGAPFSSSRFNSEKLGKPLVRIRDLPNESPAVFTTEVHPKGYLLHPGDIAVGMDGEFRAYLWAGVESWLNQRVCVFVPQPGYSASFVRNSIIDPLAQVEATETATTVIHLGKSDIDRFTILIPDAPVAEAFERQCQPWYDQIVANKQLSRTLATLRDMLLPKLLSGQLSVADLHDSGVIT